MQPLQCCFVVWGGGPGWSHGESPFPHVTCCFLCGSIELRSVVPVDSHFSERSLKAGPSLLQKLLNSAVSFVFLNHFCCIIMVKYQRPPLHNDFLLPSFLQDHLFNHEFQKMYDHRSRWRVTVRFLGQRPVCPLDLQVDIWRQWELCCEQLVYIFGSRISFFILGYSKDTNVISPTPPFNICQLILQNLLLF